jgi:hypothetical protein
VVLVRGFWISETTCLIICRRYWADFPYETESISIRDGGTSPRIEPPPRTPKKNKKPVVIVCFFFFLATIDAKPFLDAGADMRERSIYCDEGKLSERWAYDCMFMTCV